MLCLLFGLSCLKKENVIMFRFKVLAGSHFQDGKEYGVGSYVFSERDLASVFGNKFRLVDEDPRPKVREVPFGEAVESAVESAVELVALEPEPELRKATECVVEADAVPAAKPVEPDSDCTFDQIMQQIDAGGIDESAIAEDGDAVATDKPDPAGVQLAVQHVGRGRYGIVDADTGKRVIEETFATRRVATDKMLAMQNA
jgi:hypothetical protein